MKSPANDVADLLKSIQTPQEAPERRPEPTRTHPGPSTPKGLTTRYTLNGEVCKVMLVFGGSRAVVRVGFKVGMSEGLGRVDEVVAMVLGFRVELERHAAVELFVTAPGMLRKLRVVHTGEWFVGELTDALTAALGGAAVKPRVTCRTSHNGHLLDIEADFHAPDVVEAVLVEASQHGDAVKAVRVTHVNSGSRQGAVYAGRLVDCSINRTVESLAMAVRSIVTGG